MRSSDLNRLYQAFSAGHLLAPTVKDGAKPNEYERHRARLRNRHLRRTTNLVSLIPFTDDDDMLREVNDSPFGLSGSIWCNNITRALRTARRVQSGVLSINTNSSVYIEAPFGGYKQSGIGRDLGMHGLANFTEVKNVFIYLGEDA